MAITVEFTTTTGFVHTVGFGAEYVARGDAELIAMARPFAAKEWAGKIKVSAEVDRAENSERAKEAILAAAARVLRV